MAVPRLPFLWPMLFKPLKASRSVPRLQTAPHARSSRTLTSAARHAEGPSIQRYGTAQEPAPHLRDANASLPQEKPEEVKPTATNPAPEPVEEEEEEEETAPTATPSAQPAKAASTADIPIPESAPEPPQLAEPKPPDTVLHMPSPAEEEERKPPHLKTPRYLHHFDTYGLVKRLAKGGYTEEQAITTMKAVRGLLTDNMELAREGLVSKSKVENGTYLFRAACSELRTEVGNSRKGEIEKARTERNQLQHEVDILNQRLTQELMSLKDELKGLFDDRKMVVRQEQRTMETKIQELNYQIAVTLNSDARSEVEGLRWVLTRRAAITVAVSALMLLGSLRYMTYVSHVQEEEKKAHKRKPPSGEDHNNGGSPVTRDNIIGGELLATEGGVSLG
ncbi:hypothetical protein P154DRAFT_574126 [Amniculicola lignicola CBS 123094]|uniref:DUF1640-domain-containing protein n=1 Tax=Amniculicola lignicola CBS 123094 TaxID=1392246 RepID=A0A6A5WKT6_9PLEO|nr:hypothetical protein P154DRAFT_574126 [Amniculicola lignicola CBS 123094]